MPLVFTPLQLAYLHIAIGQSIITVALFEILNLNSLLNNSQIIILGLTLFFASLGGHHIYFNKNKKYLRLFFWRKRSGPHKLDLVILILIIVFVKAFAITLESR